MKWLIKFFSNKNTYKDLCETVVVQDEVFTKTVQKIEGFVDIFKVLENEYIQPPKHYFKPLSDYFMSGEVPPEDIGLVLCREHLNWLVRWMENYNRKLLPSLYMGSSRDTYILAGFLCTMYLYSKEIKDEFWDNDSNKRFEIK